MGSRKNSVPISMAKPEDKPGPKPAHLPPPKPGPKPRPKRVHPTGRLTFRKNVRDPKSDSLPYRIAEDEALNWSALVPASAGEVEIEIGCGKGSFLMAAAERRPETFFLGVEAGPAYAEYCADRAKRKGYHNVYLVADDARLFLADTVPAGRIQRVHIYYPDPWPKWRHRKRRIFSAELPPLLHKVIASGGELLVATDNLRYFGEILAVLGESPLLARALDLEVAYGPEDPGLAFGPTNFSRKYKIEGRTLRTCAWRRRDLAPEDLANAVPVANEMVPKEGNHE